VVGKPDVRNAGWAQELGDGPEVRWFLSLGGEGLALGFFAEGQEQEADHECN